MFRIYLNFDFFGRTAAVKEEKGKLEIASQAPAKVPSARYARSAKGISTSLHRRN
jgi:hypothetical protein